MRSRQTALLSKETRQDIKRLADLAGSYNAAFEYLLSLRDTNYKTGKAWAELAAMEAAYMYGFVHSGSLRKATGCGANICKVVAQSYKDEALSLTGAGDTKRLYFRFTERVADKVEGLLSHGGNWERLCRYLLALQSPRFDKGALHVERTIKRMHLEGEPITSYSLSMEATKASKGTVINVYKDYKLIADKV